MGKLWNVFSPWGAGVFTGLPAILFFVNNQNKPRTLVSSTTFTCLQLQCPVSLYLEVSSQSRLAHTTLGKKLAFLLQSKAMT